MSGVFFILFSIVVGFLALRLPGGTLEIPGPMIFPLLLGVSLFALSILLFVQSKPSAQIHDTNIFPRGEVIKVLYVLAAFFLSLLVFERMGFVISILALLTLLFRGIGHKTIARSILYALIISLTAYLSFYHLLGVRLPKGALNF